MTQAEVKVFEPEVVVFPANREKESAAPGDEKEIVEAEKRTLKTDLDKRFARLKKSIRKRSAGIF